MNNSFAGGRGPHPTLFRIVGWAIAAGIVAWGIALETGPDQLPPRPHLAQGAGVAHAVKLPTPKAG